MLEFTTKNALFDVRFVQIGHLKKGLNPPSLTELAFGSPHLTIAIKTGIITGVIALAVSGILFSSYLRLKYSSLILNIYILHLISSLFHVFLARDFIYNWKKKV